MQEFHYTARTSTGGLIDGTLRSPNRVAALLQLEGKGYVPVTIGSKETAPKEDQPAKSPTRPNPEKSAEVAGATTTLSFEHRQIFTEQLAQLLEAGLPLDQALAILARRMQQPRLKSLSGELHRALIEGQSFSQALRHYPRIFSSLYVNLVSAGEASGALQVILHRLVAHLQGIKNLRERVQQALLYPAVLVVAGIGLAVTFTTVMVPKLTGFFKGTGQPLPPATRVLIDFNDWLTHSWWMVVLALAGVAVGVPQLLRSPQGRAASDRFVWNLPVIGAVLRCRFYAQFSRTLGTLMENGVTLLRSLELLEGVAGNLFVRERMTVAREAVADGTTLSNALDRQKIFPPLFIDMLAIGEQTGQVDKTMHLIAEIQERQLDKQVQVISTLIPPAVMALIASLVGFVVYAIMSAVFGMTQNLNGTIRH